MKQKLKQKVKSYSFWTGLSASVVILIESIASIFGAQVDEEIITNLVMAVCGVLVMLGIVVMPVTENKTNADAEETKEIDDQTDKQEKDE